ncbi:uncharacterized protein LOC133176880 [Saccostrea echinata]|uniref:uncharacterized protein LOC133176880 n=1 Tax=Saccostrea echinata TaxID=191078 RepID=UPI002A83FB81|nr:uncharacterized protein LOC133176880 [Saccostrea echinata]XP_061167920.1 uncharacterized protein LOC133176880 [Saccostrea echinata]
MIPIIGFFRLMVISVVPVFAEGTLSFTYEFGEDCSVSLEDVNENLEIYAEYHGKDVSSWCDYFSFNGRGRKILDEYEICVRPIYFRDPDCSLRLDYKSSYNGRTLQSVSCEKNSNTKYCGSQDEYLYIYFEKRNGKSTSKASFRLHITARKVFDYEENQKSLVGAIVGGVVGGCFFVAVVTGICCWCACRRKPSQGQVLNPTQANAVPLVNQPAYPYPSHNVQHTENNTGTYPPANYAAQYTAYNSQPQYNPQPGYNTQPQYNTQAQYNSQPQYDTQPQYQSSETSGWQEPEKQASAPPPSYDEVNK